MINKAAVLLGLLVIAADVHAFDLMSHPDTAGNNAIFFNASLAAYHPAGEWEVTVPKFKFSLDYVFPWLLPFFTGVYMEAPDPNLTSFGVRGGYHFDMEIDNLDIYLMYCFDFGFTRWRRLRAEGAPAPEVRYYDFRAGLRYVFGKLFGLYIESDYKLDALILGLTIKLN